MIVQDYAIDDRLARGMRSVANACVGFVIPICIVDYVGHLAHIPLFTSVLTGFATMKFNTATVLLLVAVAMLLRQKTSQWWTLRLADVVAVLATVLALLTLLEYFPGINTHVDKLLFDDPYMPANGTPGRMSSASAITLSFLTLATLTEPLFPRLCQWMAICALTPATLALLGYTYGVAALYHIQAFSSMALNTSIAIVLLGVAKLCRQPAESFLRVLTRATPGADFARSVLAATFAIPLILGLISLDGVRQGRFETPFGLAIMAMGTIISLAGTVMWNALALDRADAVRHRAESERDKLLESELAARTRAETALAARDQLLAVVSHELRQPLTPVLLAANALKTRKDLHDDARADVDLIVDQIQAESRLVNNLLDMAAINQNRIKLKSAPIDLNPILKNLVDGLSSEARQQDVFITFEAAPAPPMVVADANRLRQILYNVLANAIKFTPGGGHVALRTRADDQSVSIDIQDSGIGFDADTLPRLFTMFEQGDNSLRRQFGGMGVGLSIARHLAELHGGKLTATSLGKDRGATFTLVLPRAQMPSAVAS